MHHALAVRVVQGRGDLLGHPQHVLHVQAGAQVPVQVAPAQVLHRQIRRLAVEPGVQDADDVGMVEALDDGGFLLEAIARRWNRERFRRQELDGHLARICLLHGQIHPRRTAGADQALDSVARKRRRRQRCAVVHRVRRLRQRCSGRQRRNRRRLRTFGGLPHRAAGAPLVGACERPSQRTSPRTSLPRMNCPSRT